MFHGANAIRMNLALPLSRVKEAFERLDKYVFKVKTNFCIANRITVGDIFYVTGNSEEFLVT